MIYELIYGHSPFIANCPNETFNLIINSHSKKTGIKYPENFDKDAKRFIKELCRYDPQKRFKDFEKIRSLKFFNGAADPIIPDFTQVKSEAVD